MKNFLKFFPVALAGFALASCSNDDLFSVNGEQEVLDPNFLYVTVEGEEHFEAEQILDSSIRYNRLWYLVRYKDYPDPSEDTWEPPENLWNCPDLIRDFHNRYPDKPNPNSLPSSSRRLASRRTRS